MTDRAERVAIVLAAGKGTRMESDLPKVLAGVCGRPMIDYVLDALETAGIQRTIMVIGYGAELVREALEARDHLEFAVQSEQLGTGHAVMMCRELLGDHDGPVLVLAGDQPMTQPESIRALFEAFEAESAACIMGTVHRDNPAGLGRIVRDREHNFVAIVEERDASDQQREITEVNMSYYVFNCRDMLSTLEDIRADNSQGEYYLTDCPGLLLKQGKTVRALDMLKPCESLSVNTVAELAAVEEALREGN
jgi:bifunctional UDP-N-acetylglucosamine pyrophosphorylase/glucosamine-1-phosphate N-acetyltransferase